MAISSESTPLYVIGAQIDSAWRPRPPAAEPYIKAMRYLEGRDDKVNAADSSQVVRNLLVMMRDWQAPPADGIREMLRRTLQPDYHPALPTTTTYAEPVTRCETCGSELVDKFVRGRTVRGERKVMCVACHLFFGAGLGPELGELYARRANGNWELVPSGVFRFQKQEAAAAPPQQPRWHQLKFWRRQ